MPAHHGLEELPALRPLDQREQRADRLPHVAQDSEVHPGAPPQPGRLDVHLRRSHAVGQELVIREVGAEHEKQVRTVHGRLAGAVSEQAAHPDVERVVVLDVLLAAQAVADRGGDLVGEGDHVVVRRSGPCAREDRHLLAALMASASARNDSASGITRGIRGRVRMSGAAGRELIGNGTVAGHEDSSG